MEEKSNDKELETALKKDDKCLVNFIEVSKSQIVDKITSPEKNPNTPNTPNTHITPNTLNTPNTPFQSETINVPKKRGRGRPRKYPKSSPPPSNVPKRGRGRPRKYPKPASPYGTIPKRGRGRPRKSTTLDGKGNPNALLKSPTAELKESRGRGRPRGRPKKKLQNLSMLREQAKAALTPKRPGRPRKEQK